MKVLAVGNSFSQDATAFLHEAFPRYHRDQLEMFERVHSSYHAMARKHKMELIPCGEIIQNVRALPPFHVQTGDRSLCGIDTVRNTFVPVSEEEVSAELLDLIRRTVDAVIVKESV